MPFITDPAKLAADPQFQSAVKSALEQYLFEQVQQQMPWTTPGGNSNPYNQRRNWFGNYSQNYAYYGTSLSRLAARLIADLDSTMLQQASGTDLYRFIIQDNPTGRSLFDAQYGVAAGYNNVGYQDSRAVFNVLIGLSANDFV